MWKFIILLLLFSGCTAQKKPETFTFNWDISEGVFTVTFLNTPYNDNGTSLDKLGYFTTNCRQTYLDFINKLIQYGNTPAHFEGVTDHTDNLDIITEPSHPYILIIDNSGRCWKITKPKALILANQLNQTIWINWIQICEDIPCQCN